MGLLSTAVSVACIARDLWKGLNAGSLVYDPPPSAPVAGRDRGAGSWDALFCALPVLEDGRLVGACDRPRQHVGDCWVDEPQDLDAVDEDPPRPEVVWRPGWIANLMVASGDTWHAQVSIVGEPTDQDGAVCRWSVVVGGAEETSGITEKGDAEAKRRAEEALVVMLERLP
jgi:hypothetical protein